MSLLYPWVLAALPILGLVLWLLERWRQEPLVLEVADLALFTPRAASEEEARAAERRRSWRFWSRLLALSLLVLAASAPRVAVGPPGPLVVEAVLSRGLSASARPAGASLFERNRAALREVVAGLRPEDRVRLHLVPGPPARLLSRNEAYLALEQVRPAAAESDLARTLEPLLAPRPGPQPPVFCASERDPGLQSPRLQLALAGGPYRNRGVVALRRSGTNLHATLVGAPGPVELSFAARSPGGEVLTGRFAGELEEGQPLLASWSHPALAEALEASVRLVGADELSADDQAFAVASPSRARRVAVSGELSAPLRRALLAVERVQLEDLAPGASPAGCDLLILNDLPKVLPEVPLVVVPTSLPSEPLPGGLLGAGAGHPAWRHLSGRLSHDPVQVAGLTPPPEGLPRALPLVLAGSEPLILVTGSPRPQVVVLRTPATGPWTEREAFPLLWAELLEALAPQSAGELRAYPAGQTHPALGHVPWGLPRRVLSEGRPLLGSVARPASPPEVASAQPFPPGAAQLLAAARPPAPERDLAPWLALLALPFVLGALWPAPSLARTPREERRQLARG